jgi:hypothetical protein
MNKEIDKQSKPSFVLALINGFCLAHFAKCNLPVIQIFHPGVTGVKNRA